MGRRKIEIKAIKDDRNRSVTFLKRKGGLFKKAHELSVLCSVEVAVIIFGTNKKLYEYSSHDIDESIQKYQYYGGPHEHKGPADYQGKSGGGDDDDDEDGEEQGEDQNHGHGQPQQQQPQQQHPHPQGPGAMPGQPLYPPHLRHPGPSASPPIGNGHIPYPRQRTPQPPMGMGSRPASRNDIIHRRSTPGIPQHTPPLNQAPMHHPHSQGPHTQNGYPGMPSQVYQQMQNGQQQVMYHHQPPQPQQPHTGGFAPPGFSQFPPNHPQHAQMQQMYAQEQQRRESMPPQFQEPPRPQSHPQVQIQEPPQPQQTMSPPQLQQEHQQEGLQAPQPKAIKHNSIFTPIDNSRSMLAASWGIGASPIDKQETPVKASPDDRSKSVETGAVRPRADRDGDRSRPEPPFQPQRTQSTVSIAGSDASKRPRLKVHIPSEPSEDGISAGSAPVSTQKGPATESTSNSTPSKGKDGPGGSGVVLPPPSPSASAILSAGATGPPNPFARPLPPQSNGTAQANTAAFSNNQATAFDAQTPMSALPSRFAGQLLPSPSQFFSDWGNFGRNGDESAILPSPLNFQTPVLPNGPNFGSGQTATNEGEGDERKRKLEDEKDGGGEKRLKT